ncbi:MAG: hypothetical protein ACYS32_07885 [Planctomycetota bacterium]|jgi:hypothetical protein
MRTLISIVVVIFLLSIVCFANEVTVISWNVESGGADPGVVASQIVDMNGVDIWGLCEVDASWAQGFEQAAEGDEPGDFNSVLGTTGNTDRLLILYDNQQFTELERLEIG